MNLPKLQQEAKQRHRKAYKPKPIWVSKLDRATECNMDKNFRGLILYGRKLWLEEKEGKR